MDYSKIQNGMESIIEALKESNSTSNGVEYSGISDMLHGQSDILKNFLQGSFSADMRADMKKAIEASTGQGQAEATTDLVKSVKVVAEFKAHLEDLNLGSIESLSDKLDDLTATLSRTDLEELNSDINTLTKVCTDNRADIARVHDSMNAQFDTLGVDLFKRMDEIDEKAISSEAITDTNSVDKLGVYIEKLGVNLKKSLNNVGETIDAQFQNTGERLTELGNSMDTLFSHTDTGQESAKQEVISAVYDQLGNLQREILTESQLKEYVSQTRQETESQYHETHRMLTVCLERLNSIEDTQIATDQKALEEKLESIEPDEGISTKKAILNLESRIKLLESWVCSLSEDCDNYKRKIDLLVEKA